MELKNKMAHFKFSKGFWFTFGAAIAWAISIVLTRSVLQSGENAYNVLFWTSLFAMPFYVYLLAKSRHQIAKLTKHDYWILGVMALVSSVGISVVEFLALKYSPAMNYSFLIRTVILFTFVFAYIFLGEKFTKKKFILASVILAGAYFLTTNGHLLSLTLGDAFTRTEAALIAFGNNVLGKMSVGRMSAAISSSMTVILSFLPKVAVVLFFTHIVFPQHLFLLIVLTIAFIALMQLRFAAYQHASASYVTMIFSFTPVFVLFMAIPLLGETMTPVQMIGGIFIILAGVLVEKLQV